MNKRLVYGVIGGCLVILIGLAVGAFLYTHERVEEEYDLGPERELVLDSHLTLQTYLERLEIDVDRDPNIHDTKGLDEADLIFLRLPAATNEEWLDEVMGDWVAEGGHVVLVEPTLEQIEVWWSLLWDELFSIEEIDFDSGYWASIVEEYAVGDDHWYFEVDWAPVGEEVVLSSQADFAAVSEGERTPIFVSGPVGQGRVTVVPADDFLTNDGLKRGEIAGALADVMSLQPGWPESSMIVLRDQRWSWIGEVFRAGWPVFLAIFLLLVFGLSRARRFGPTIPEPDRRRRRRADHIRAVGHFLWDNQGGDVLVESARRALIEAMARRRPSTRTMSPARRLELMAQHLDVSQDLLRSLLYGPIPRKPGSYTSMIAQIENLRRKL